MAVSTFKLGIRVVYQRISGAHRVVLENKDINTQLIVDGWDNGMLTVAIRYNGTIVYNKQFSPIN